jgi:hypothetical protein
MRNLVPYTLIAVLATGTVISIIVLAKNKKGRARKGWALRSLMLKNKRKNIANFPESKMKYSPRRSSHKFHQE